MSYRELVLGIDLGTTGVKSVLADLTGKPLRQESAEYPTVHCHDHKGAEQSAHDWWKVTAECVSRLAVREEKARIAAIAVSSQAPTLLGVDREGQPTGNALIWMDRRAGELCGENLLPCQDEITAYSGNRVDPYFMLPKLMWQRKERPEQAAVTERYLQANGWIVSVMTGIQSIDNTHAVLTQLYNVHENRWEDAAFEHFGIGRDQMPCLYQPWEVVGQLKPKPAEELGLIAGIPVVAGCTDGAACALGLGLTKTGQIFEMSGQSSGIGVIMDAPKPNPNLILLRHAMENRWILKGSMSATGGSLKWFRDNIDRQTENPAAYVQYDGEAAASPPGAGGLIFLPYLNGERTPIWDSNARGILFGFCSDSNRSDLLRAIMEGTAYGLRSILEEFPPEMLSGNSILGSGGGYRSALWAQIKADVLGLPIHAKNFAYDAGAVGAAFLALRGIGVTGITVSDEDTEEQYIPNDANKAIYMERYDAFLKLYKNNRLLF